MIQPPYGKPWLLFALLGCSLALNALMVLDRPGSQAPPPAETSAAPQATTAALTAEAAPSAPAEADALIDAVAQPATGPLPPDTGEWQVTQATVEHSLARTFQAAIGEKADALSAVYTRLFVWDLDVRRDLQQGDRVRVAWRESPEGQLEIAAATFRSRKHNQTYTAYRWKAPGDAYASYWRANGEEVAVQLMDSPLESYEQITSLLKDRPTHKGMDFKLPVGSPVRTPRSGTVTRVNWNWAANGNCIEVKYDDGVLAKFLHLDELKTSAGARVQTNQVIALSGNTGHSTAPHLHYQLDQGDKNIDPLDYHGTARRQLPQEMMPTFLTEVERLNKLLESAS